MASEERFGYEWNKYRDIEPIYEAQFRSWISPLSENDFAGKDVLDAGCGMGRNSFWLLRFGARSVLAFDRDERSLNAARSNLASFKNVKIENHDIHDPRIGEQFDLVMSIGVIHHLEHPEQALNSLYKLLRPGGKLVVWVYSREGYEWVDRYISPLRKHVTSRLPLSIVHVLSYFLSVPLWLYIKISPNRTKSVYLRQLSQFKFWHVHSIVFDQLIPTIANYWTKQQVQDLFIKSGISNIQINRPPHDSGWTIIATK